MDDENKDLIYVLNKQVRLCQAPEGFRTSMDSVMLAAACPAKKNHKVLDLGCGVGSAGICVLHRVKDTKLLGIDFQADHIELAEKNADLNNMKDRAVFVCADVRDISKANIDTFDHVICNPPYKEAGAHRRSPSMARARAMGYIDDDVSLRSWIDSAWHNIKGQGSITIIHEASQCDSIIQGLYSTRGGRRFGNIEIIPLFPKVGVNAKRVIIRAWKHKKGGSRLLPGITLHNADGSYTPEADNILRGGQALFAL